MILVDVNLLLYATNPRYPEHAQVKAWWESQINGTQRVGLSWLTVSSFIRIGTNPRIFRCPLSRAEAVRCVDEWLSHAAVRVVEPSAHHWQTFQRLLLTVKPGPDLVTDAHLAAMAMDHDCELNSSDDDFKDFPGLRWRNPLAPTKVPAS